MIKWIDDDIIKLFKTNNYDYLIHQTNGLNTHNGGVARIISHNYPQLKDKRTLTVDNFGSFYLTETDNGIIVNLVSQWYLGNPTEVFITNSLVRDNFETRLKALTTSLTEFFDSIVYFPSNSFELDPDYSVICPLIASGLAADKQLKGNKTDLEYFKQYILPTIEEVLNNYPNIELTIVNYVK